MQEHRRRQHGNNSELTQVLDGFTHHFIPSSTRVVRDSTTFLLLHGTGAVMKTT